MPNRVSLNTIMVSFRDCPKQIASLVVVEGEEQILIRPCRQRNEMQKKGVEG